ncbi:Rha family transcriptional regulator [Clostridium tyrobutyricum]|jgi:phage regulator Rha-like protein|uniref:Rha family transcriptional regulator n=1 Tax=Clostridium tyrobutyricum TaxID=1519 RepID=UPI001C38AC21|nr:Rha family transcriptional regulator [Clostridium tyrobutyricum]MBV4429042.1 Rha family transcriptional regulator [Clostridium tyrobutyricum]MBV4444119.1 Rha family transcriptional regulator [Clostridium tyrobutyricum]
MDNLVFINSNNLQEEPYTTSKIISEYGGQQHKNVRELIQTYIKKMKKLGKVSTFETHKPKSPKGGRPEKIYKLNEPQATFLITLMKNTERVVNFKFELVKQFYVMREELLKRRIERSNGIRERNALTDAIKNLPDSKYSKVYKHRLYINITRLIYKILFNKTVTQLKKQFSVPEKGNLRDYIPKTELAKTKALENQAATLINARLSYQKIKEALISIHSITV